MGSERESGLTEFERDQMRKGIVVATKNRAKSIVVEAEPCGRSFDAIVLEHRDTCPGNSDADLKDDGFLERLRFLALALNGEAGEVANDVKKEWRGDASIQDDYQSWEAKLEKEICDAGIYLCMIASHMQIDLQDRMRDKFIEFEGRPEWAGLKERAKT